MKELPKGDWGVRGTWHGKLAPTAFENHAVVIICCPICRSDSSLAVNDIAPDGTLRPVFYCPYGCGFKSSIKLIGYEEFLRSFKALSDPKPDEGIEQEPETNHS